MISSLSNPKFKKVRRLQADKRFRSNQQQFVIEGTRWIAEMVNDPRLQDLFYTELWYQQADHAQLIAQLSGRTHQVSDEVMSAMSATKTAPGVLAVVAISPAVVPQNPSLILILDSISNPGNLGTMLRTAAAAGVDAVLLSPDCVDIYNPKVVRGSMGALLRLPVYQYEWEKIAEVVAGCSIWIASVNGNSIYTAVDWRKPAALVIGNEAWGAGENAYDLATGSISIPMNSATESLNAAVAASIILFEAVRQRTQA